jgi:hypothetical protein
LVKSISANAFYNCSAITTISFPEATNIGGYAFMNCTALEKLILPNSSVMAAFDLNVFSSAPNAILYVADELLSNYKNQYYLSSMSASRIKPISELPT